MKRFLNIALIIGGLMFTIHCKAYCPTPLHEVQNRHTAKGDGLKGNVFSVKTYDVDFKLEFGEYIKGDNKHEHIVYYDENGYRLGESTTYSHKKYLISRDSIFIGTLECHSIEDFEVALFSGKLPDYECRDAVREYMKYNEKGRLISIIRDHDWRKTKQTFEYTPTGYKGKYFSQPDDDPQYYEMKSNVFTPNVKYGYNCNYSISYYNKDGYLERYYNSNYIGNKRYKYHYYKYNVYGHLVKSGIIWSDRNKVEYVYQYEYDDQGNWISRKKFDCDETIDGKYKMIEWQMRTIAYKTPEENVAYRKEYEREKIATETKPNYTEPIFTAVEQRATYPGGEAELMKWIGESIEYPKSAQEEGVQGRIVVQFVIEKDGSIGEVKVVRGKHPDLDKEAVRVIKTIPVRFTPAKQNGQVVRSWFTLPIMFKLQP